MKNYYCTNCHSCYPYDEIIDGVCPSCCKRRLVEIPDFETVSQWEDRTGLKYPDSAPVYVRVKELNTYMVFSLRDANIYIVKGEKYTLIPPYIVATEAGAPPDDWSPEVSNAN